MASGAVTPISLDDRMRGRLPEPLSAAQQRDVAAYYEYLGDLQHMGLMQLTDTDREKHLTMTEDELRLYLKSIIDFHDYIGMKRTHIVECINLRKAEKHAADKIEAAIKAGSEDTI